jgi:DNA-binding phage protein
VRKIEAYRTARHRTVSEVATLAGVLAEEMLRRLRLTGSPSINSESLVGDALARRLIAVPGHPFGPKPGQSW